MPEGKRLWRTAKDELVEDGHPDAVSLAYGVDDELSAEDAKQAPAPRKKQAPAAHNKQAKKPADK